MRRFTPLFSTFLSNTKAIKKTLASGVAFIAFHALNA